eukprot:CAMPEP_0174738528 /NCGR_PEP_ID=MMETSP1094-20130205/70109_1 /TAXON_ID=156173 /ORGANISM="Chrysochromulina brevifilum, Strain UTEX LB 985" /LENGTH=273 /DNA_ID=CAMNT_0015941961 /DNA_START=137 /DNA_END=955 /DNA_ORIENTATION=+
MTVNRSVSAMRQVNTAGGATEALLPNPKSFPTRPNTQRPPQSAQIIQRKPRPPAHTGRPDPGELNWAALATRLPLGRDERSSEQRRSLFRRFDVNGNGHLSFAEVDKAVRDVLKSNALFNLKPVLMKAFQAARCANGKQRGMSGDFVERNEFRLLLRNLRVYFELFRVFSLVDTTDDMSIDRQEFQAGLSALAGLGVQLSAEDADRVFELIDDNHSGLIRFDEFASWIIAQNLSIDHEAEELEAVDVVPLPSPPLPSPLLKARPASAYAGKVN